MSELAERFARGAESLVGAPFRLHGRDVATGLDCVGVIACALASCGLPVVEPRPYRLRMTGFANLDELAAVNGFEAAVSAIARGDLLLVTPGPGQFHLMCAVSPGSAVHAHAGLRRVVRQPLCDGQGLRSHFRLAPTRKES